MNTITIPMPWPHPPLLINQITNGRAHFAYKNARTQALTEATWAVKAAHIPPIVGCDTATLHYRPANRRSIPDSDGIALTLKVAIDALIKAGVITSDAWPIVTASGQRIHEPIPGEPGATWLELAGVTYYDKEPA